MTDHTDSLPEREPVVTTGMVVAAVEAIIVAAVAFGLDLTPEQVAAVIGLAAVLGPIISSVIARQWVTPYEPKRRAGDADA